MKITYTLDLNNEDTQDDADMIHHARDMYSAIDSISREFRHKYKYTDEPCSWEDAYTLFWTILNDHCIGDMF